MISFLRFCTLTIDNQSKHNLTFNQRVESILKNEKSRMTAVCPTPRMKQKNGLISTDAAKKIADRRAAKHTTTKLC